MALKYSFLLGLFFYCHSVVAQHSFENNTIKKIDSLILYNKFEAAQKITDSIYKELQSQKNSKALLLEVKYRKALILDRQNKLPNEPLQILLKLVDEAKSNNLYSLSCRVNLLIALCYEKVTNLELVNQYLNMAYDIYQTQKLENLYSTYCIRRSSYFRFLKQNDSAFYYANKAKEYAEKYNNETDLTDSYILLGIVAFRNKNYTSALEYYLLIKHYREKYNDTLSLAMSYINIARCFNEMKDFKKAMIYCDSSYFFFKSKSSLLYNFQYPKMKYEIFENLGNIDSAYYFL